MLYLNKARQQNSCPRVDVAYLRISKVSIYVSSPQGLVRHHGLFDIDYHFKLIK